MTGIKKTANGTLLFYCTRQKPSDHEELITELRSSGKITEIEVPCAGRIGTGELMQVIASGYNRVVVLACGGKSCVHGFGCSEARKAWTKARELAQLAGISPDRLVFIEADTLKKGREISKVTYKGN